MKLREGKESEGKKKVPGRNELGMEKEERKAIVGCLVCGDLEGSKINVPDGGLSTEPPLIASHKGGAELQTATTHGTRQTLRPILQTGNT